MKRSSNFQLAIKYNFGKYSRLAISIIVDLLGMLTYGAPGAGEFGDVIWAFISFAIIKSLYSDKDVFSWAFLEELLPFTDIIPSGCISWYNSYHRNGFNTYDSYLDRQKEIIN